ncbi:hypothetical protein CL616_04965 [archaeon]|nr:hypothetical protein [archaeon]|tara:strand:+ start:2209 stop:2553 length:345 start_codon:yes stop_codon:yes gene_type:complete
MEEKTLLRIALITSFLGIFSLFFLCEFMEMDLTKISEIDELLLDKKVKVEGEVSNVKETSSMLLFDIKDESGKIKVVVFSDKKIDLDEFVSVEGKVMEYEGEMEISAEKIEYVH